MSENLSAIDRILSRSEEIEVYGNILVMHLPDDEQAKKIRAWQASIAKEIRNDSDDVDMESYSELICYTTAAVLRCDMPTAERLLVATGGELGFLFSAIQSFMGFTKPEETDGVEDFTS